MIRSFIKSDHLKLIPILILAFYFAFIPHQSYSYPVHVDEWNHMALSMELIDNGGVEGLTNPLSGGEPLWNQMFEIGFHLFWGVFQQLSGISWLEMIRYFPGIIFMLTVLSVYILCRRQGFGWESALCACLVPTLVGILGPGFLVPVAMGMLFIPLSLFIAFNFPGWRGYLILLIFALFLITIHAPTSIALIIVLVPYLVLNLRRNYKHALGIALAAVIPFAVPLPWIWNLIGAKMGELFSPSLLPEYVDLPKDFAVYGYIPTALFILGIYVLISRRGDRNYGLVFGALSLLAMVVMFFKMNYGISLVYLRGFVHLQLMMGVVAGAGIWWLRHLRLASGFSKRIPSVITNNLANVLAVVVILLTLYVAIPSRNMVNYYHMIDTRDYKAFTWIANNIDESYDKAILDPWKGTAFTALTGRKVFTRILMGADRRGKKAYLFLEEGCTDTSFLKKKGISIVYTRGGCNNPDLVKVSDYVYILPEAARQEE
ncbi:hypothetical protein ACFLV3_01635 [Chloroflexota bacterium]